MAGLLSSALMGPAQRLGAVAAPEAAATPMAPGGLLSMFAPQAAASPLYSAFDQRRNVLMGALLGGVGAESPLERLRGIAQGAMKGREADQAHDVENQTAKWLARKYGVAPEDAMAIARNPEVMKAFLKKQFDTTEGSSVYGTPIYGTDAHGKTVLGVIGKDGAFKQLDTGGVTPTPGVTWQDFGTYRQGFGKGGQAATPQIGIDNAGKAADTAAGKAQGEAVASYRSMASKLPGLQGVVNELDKIAEEATYTLAGQGRDAVARQFGITTDGALARTKYIAMVDNQILPLLRDTFGAQFTVAEGESLRATLGDPNKSPQEKQAVLKAFIEQKKRDVEALALQSMGQLPGQMPAPQGNATSSGVQWSIEP